MPRRAGSRGRSIGDRDEIGIIPNIDFRIDVSGNQRVDVSGNSRKTCTFTGTNKKINDLDAATSATTSMLIETDLGGSTSNSLTLEQYLDLYDNIFTTRRYLFWAGIQCTNLPASAQFLCQGLPLLSVIPIDTTGCTQVRFGLVANDTVYSGTKVYLKYRTSYSATYADYSDPCATEQSFTMTHSAATAYQSTWTDLVAGAIGSPIYFAFGSSDGDGVVDPIFYKLNIEVR